MPRLLLLLPALAACAGGVSTDDTGPADTGDTADATGLRTLATCGTDVGADVPEPWASLFACAEIVYAGDHLAFHATALPPHPSPYYPQDDPNWVAFDTRDGRWHQNPNELSAQDLLLNIPLDPTPRGITITAAMVDEEAGTSRDEYHAQNQGVGLDGTALFTGVAAPGDDIEEELYTFDTYEGHPQESGVYHHHSSNPAALAVLADRGLVTTTAPGEAEIELYGVMCDGTFVLGCPELDGTTPTASALDAQGGHVGDLTLANGDSFGAARYHVHACGAYGRDLTPEIQYYDDGSCF